MKRVGLSCSCFIATAAWLFALTITLLSLAEAATDPSPAASQCEPLPCLLNNGCQCNHSAPFTLPTDQQVYGTCTSCDAGWTGKDCATRFDACANGGTFVAANNACECPLGWTGAACDALQCINSQKGTGPHRVAAPSAVNNTCDYPSGCLDGFSGVQCQLCDTDAACGAHQTCDKSLLPLRSNHKSLQCDVLSDSILLLLGSGKHVNGKALISCDFATAAVAPSGPESAPLLGNVTRDGFATCQIQFFRIEVNATWIDPFFFCELDNCTATNSIGKGIDPTASSIPSSDGFTRSVAEAILLASCFVLAINDWIFPSPNRAKRTVVRWCARVLLATVVVVVLVFGLGLDPSKWDLVHRIMHWNATQTGSVAQVNYNCPVSRCRCAPDPPSNAFSPFCHSSLFGEHILPVLQHGATVDCNGDTGLCNFNQKDLNTPIALQCRSGDCTAVTNASQNDLTPGRTVAASDTSTAHHSSATALAFFGGAFVIAATLVHFFKAYTGRPEKALRFKKAFLDDVDGELHARAAAANAALASRHDEVTAARFASDTSERPAPRSTIVPTATATASAAEDDDEPREDEGQRQRRLSPDTQDYNEAGDGSVVTFKSNVKSMADLAESTPTTQSPILTAALASPPPPPPVAGGRAAPFSGGAVGSFRYTELSPQPIPTSATPAAGSSAPSNPLNPAVAHLNAPWLLKVSRLRYTVDSTPAADDGAFDAKVKHEAIENELIDDHRSPPPHVRVGAGDNSAAAAAVTPESARRRRAAVRKLLARTRASAPKVILDDVSFVVKPGECVALMGASGAGKTSLLDILACRDKTGLLSGEISIAGEALVSAASTHPVPARAPSQVGTSLCFAKDWGLARLRGRRTVVTATGDVAAASSAESVRYDRLQRYRSVTGYVAQDDTLLPTLSVRQTLRIAAALKLPAALSAAAIDDIVDQAINALGLRRCADSIIGGAGGVRGLSGGERRRVSIAVELVGAPKVLFLDEPTSGLDSVSALRVMQCIAAIAKRGQRGAEAVVDDEDDPLRSSSSGATGGADSESDAGDMSMTTALGYGAHRAPPTPFSQAALSPVLGRWAVVQPIVIFSIHQPGRDVYRLFDTLLLLHRGQVVFHGPAADAVAQVRHILEPVLIADPPSSTNATAAATVALPRAMSSSDSLSPELANTASRWAAVRERFRRDARLALLREPPTDNAAEFLLHLVATAKADELDALTLIAHSNAGDITDVEISGGGDLGDWGVMSDAADFRSQFRVDGWRQLSILIERGRWCLLGGYHLVVAHALVVLGLGLMLSTLYHAEPLDLPGVLNRAGSVAFLQLVLALSGLSGLEAALGEKKLLALEREGSVVAGLPIFMSRVIVDLLPLRILPTVLIGCITYAPMGLRVDHGSYFIWYLVVIVLFSANTSLLTYAIGLACPGLGAAVLVSAVVILWNFVFGGLLIQATTIPALLKPFRHVSPFFLSYEAILVNELDGQTCIFAPTDASGKPSEQTIPLYCRQYVYNMGLDPTAFSGDVSMLILSLLVLSGVVWALLHSLRYRR